MVPVMAISRAVLISPMAMVTRPRDAKRPVDTTDGTADRATDNTANRTGRGIAFRRTTFHSWNNALSMSRDRRGEQSRNHGYSEFFLHRHVSVFSVERRAKHRPSPKVPSQGRGGNPLRWPLNWPVEEVMPREREPRAC